MALIKIGSRKSKLAMWQTNAVAAMLKQGGFSVEIITMETKGDKILNTSIAKIGSKGVFTEELEEQLASGAIDIAVHSAKDMPSRLPDGFSLIAFTEREKAHDVLVSDDSSLDISNPDKPFCVGTSSVRRTALLRHYYPHVQTVDMRGNLQTRIQKMRDGACEALMLAYAGVKRMEYDHLIVHAFGHERFVPPVGQGTIAIEAGRIAQEKKERIRACLNHQETEYCLLAERAFLKTLEGGCSIPAFAMASLVHGGLSLQAGLVSLDGQTLLSEVVTGALHEAEALGVKAGQAILAQGGVALLADIRAVPSV